MTEPTVNAAIESIYGSIADSNRDLDQHIARLKAAMAREGIAAAVFDSARLVQNNRSGRKLMQAYFRQKGVAVSFTAAE